MFQSGENKVTRQHFHRLLNSMKNAHVFLTKNISKLNSQILKLNKNKNNGRPCHLLQVYDPKIYDSFNKVSVK